MRTNNFLRVAALSLALAAPAFSGAQAKSFEDYSYTQDVWPRIQAEINTTQQTVAAARPSIRTDAGQQQQAAGIYDRSDRALDPHTGLRAPGLTLGGF
jgi:hypothetical protein